LRPSPFRRRYRRKYTQSYLAIASILLALPACGEDAVLELIQRIAFNDLIGNADMHLKNIALVYEDGRTATLSPAYDIVAQSVYHPVNGHALHLLPACACSKQYAPA
jgi:serine/threonine-protein kinase HipA